MSVAVILVCFVLWILAMMSGHRTCGDPNFSRSSARIVSMSGLGSVWDCKIFCPSGCFTALIKCPLISSLVCPLARVFIEALNMVSKLAHSNGSPSKVGTSR